MRPTKTQAIKSFLTARTHADLAELYSDEMETQVNVAQDGGERIDGDFRGRQWHGFSDGMTTWKPIRIPYGANTNEPSFDDNEMSFDLDAHAEGIGMTGWNWKRKESWWVGFDFDAITGHADAHKGKLSDKELEAVQTAACAISWVTVRRSTSGNGLHLYVLLEPVETNNHTEHAALGRAILGMMAAKVGFDFYSKVDVCGGNMWVWHRKMRGTPGLLLIKQGEKLDTVPDNWREHVPVVKGTKAKTLPTFIEDSPIPEIDKLFDDLTGQRANIALDDTHKKLLNWLTDNGCHAWWDQDRWMLVCHTTDLKRAHEELGFRGVFETNSKHGSAQNCFCFPNRKGAWAIRRHGLGVQEHPSWSQDGAGWTTCYYNREPDLATASKSMGGVEHKSGGYVFREASEGVKAAALLGVDLDLPIHVLARECKLKESRDGKLIVDVIYDKASDTRIGDKMQGWIAEGKHWSKVFYANLRQPTEVEAGNYDDVVRHIITEAGEDCGWTINTSGRWVGEPLAHVRPALQALGLSPKDVVAVVGSSVFKCWKLVNKPFQPEYPGDRQWNRKSAQFAYMQTENRDNLQYGTWLKVLAHSGAGLDDAIKKHGWCRANGILNGADYLKVWIASLFQYPDRPLPYLFLYSTEQNTGKSILHEALTELVTHGAVERADAALVNPQGFNGELANAVLCVVEEVDLSKAKVAANRIKDWVTSRQFPVHPKGETPYSIPNTTHWIQTANHHSYCPVLPGDTRITMIHVSPLEPHELIPKTQLIEMLKKEAPDFMAEIMNLEIPPSNDRLNVPIIVTGEKLSAQKANMTRLEAFLSENTYPVDGKMIKLSDLVERFHEWLDPADAFEWTKHKTSQAMPPQYPKGRSSKDGGQFYFGNISWEPRQPTEPIYPKLVIQGEMLKPAE